MEIQAYSPLCWITINVIVITTVIPLHALCYSTLFNNSFQMEDSLKPVPGSLSSISSNLTLIARASTFNFFSSQDSFPELLERQLRSAGLHAARGASAPTTVIS